MRLLTLFALFALAACTGPHEIAHTGTTAPVVAQADGTPAEAFIVETTTTVAVQIIPPARVQRERPTQEVAQEVAPHVIPDGAIQETICAIFGDACADALEVAECESGFDPSAVSRTNDHGIFQINITHKADFEEFTGVPFFDGIYDVGLNSEYAFKLSGGGTNWGAWACQPR